MNVVYKQHSFNIGWSQCGIAGHSGLLCIWGVYTRIQRWGHKLTCSMYGPTLSD